MQWLIYLVMLVPAMVLAAVSPMTDCYRTNLVAELRWFVDQAKPPRFRTMREWCEQEFVIPEGRYENQLWRGHRQPWAGVLVDAYDSQQWNRYVVTGCIQSGKTLMAVVLPALYYLLERGENVVCGIPSIKMADDKWRMEFLPVINASIGFRRMMPTHGPGSRSDSLGPEARIIFRNGATLKFMSGQGRDEERSAFTARILVVTEADRLDRISETSNEASQLAQLEQRVSSWAFDAQMFFECTVTTEKAFTWHSYAKESTRSELYTCCCHCKEPISPGRDHLIGYVGNFKTGKEAGKESSFFCPNCGEEITDEQRAKIQQDHLYLVHQGQSIAKAKGDDGVEITGDMPEHRTLGFKWNGFNNLFWPTAYMAEREWSSKYQAREEAEAETAIRQWMWVIPKLPDEIDIDPLSMHDVLGKHKEDARGFVPANTADICVGVDLRGPQLHYTLAALTRSTDQYDDPLEEVVIFDVGVVPVEREKYGQVAAIQKALRAFRTEIVDRGFFDKDGRRFDARFVLVDGGWKLPVVRAFMKFCKARKDRRFYYILGRGQSEPRGQSGAYNHPLQLIEGKILHIGENFHVRFDLKHKLRYFIANSDEWKKHPA